MVLPRRFGFSNKVLHVGQCSFTNCLLFPDQEQKKADEYGDQDV
jgi:hypothetical protein